MMSDTSAIYRNFQNELSKAETLDTVEQLSLKYLKRKGIIHDLVTRVKIIPLDQRKALGADINKLKKSIQADLKKKIAHLTQKTQQARWIDVTLPGKKPQIGSTHIVSTAIWEISRIFERLGFVRMAYSEVEWEYFAFESLNMPPNHPARDDFETFFIDAPPHLKYGRMLLSPHTSSGQVREMQRVGKPPIAMINIAKCYRPNWDATHTPMFHQFEGLCIDKGINITHLKGTINYFVKEFFGEKRDIRLRPFHFQFTEPSFEVDITCDICDGSGTLINKKKCRVCKSGWLELGGAGIIHPNVLKAGNIDPHKYSGWAFGFGIERVYMMKGGLKLDDMRIMYSGDIEFLKQF